LLKSCDLQFFHLEEPHTSYDLVKSATIELLSCLQQQENLKALVLILPRCAPFLGSVSTMLIGAEQGVLWPRLKILYLGVADQYWLEQFPKLEKLQMLSLQKLEPKTPAINQNAIEQLAKCRYLRVIDIGLHKPYDIEALLDIARGCPLLQKFSARNLDFEVEPEPAESLCISLGALPHLEHFELDLRFRMDGTTLQDLARHCPQLVVLELPRTRLCLSLALLTKTHPFLQLAIMNFAEIFFEDPRHLMQWDKIRGIATEWRKIFPKLRAMPCPGDYAHREADYLNEESEERASVSADDEISITEPGLDFDDSESDWLILRTKLWKVLNYEKDLFASDKIKNMWLRNLEIETVGWPVVPMDAFSDPDAHSTSARRLF
jgi:hypothetical protein